MKLETESGLVEDQRTITVIKQGAIVHLKFVQYAACFLGIAHSCEQKPRLERQQISFENESKQISI